MSETRFDVLGIGNAIVDIISRCDDALLEELNLPKGNMQLIDAEQADKLYEKMGPAIESSGGSAANTIAGLASFGGKGAFIGKVANDQFGKIFSHDIRSIGVEFTTPLAENSSPTAKCMIFVTPDGERTMNTYLGASTELDQGEVDEELIKTAKVVYLEGYLYDKEEAKAAFHQATEIAAKYGTKVALSLSDAFCVNRHRDDFRKLVKEGVDILFANEEEICALYEVESFDEAAALVKAECQVAALTRGSKGSVIVTPNETHEVNAHYVSEVVDTTGAGDLYAAGFLFGYANNQSLVSCGQLAGLAAAEIISHLGARPEENLAELAKKEGLLG
ncbi:MAG: adenosine kinase [Methyloligellaceae bacterium]